MSLELLGYAVGIALCLAIALAIGFAMPAILLLALAAVLALGARREIRRPYVLVVKIFQLGAFEVRGFSAGEMEVVHEVLDEMRRGASHQNGVPMSASG